MDIDHEVYNVDAQKFDVDDKDSETTLVLVEFVDFSVADRDELSSSIGYSLSESLCELSRLKVALMRLRKLIFFHIVIDCG